MKEKEGREEGEGNEKREGMARKNESEIRQPKGPEAY